MPAWGKIAGGGTGVALMALAGEMFRWYREADAAAAAIREKAWEKASEAGALQEALATCQETITEVVRTCAH
jgi:hypothetical protein